MSGSARKPRLNQGRTNPRKHKHFENIVIVNMVPIVVIIIVIFIIVTVIAIVMVIILLPN